MSIPSSSLNGHFFCTYYDELFLSLVTDQHLS